MPGGIGKNTTPEHVKAMEREVKEWVDEPDRYTKDLEDMLRRTVDALDLFAVWQAEDLRIEAKALLERTGYTDDF